MNLVFLVSILLPHRLFHLYPELFQDNFYEFLNLNIFLFEFRSENLFKTTVWVHLRITLIIEIAPCPCGDEIMAMVSLSSIIIF